MSKVFKNLQDFGPLIVCYMKHVKRSIIHLLSPSHQENSITDHRNSLRTAKRLASYLEFRTLTNFTKV